MGLYARHTICMVELPGNAVPWGRGACAIASWGTRPIVRRRRTVWSTISLSASYGRPVLLTLNHSAVCPLCNVRLAYLLRRARAYQNAGLSIVAFFESSPSAAYEYLDRFRASFPIVADCEGDVYERYGLKTSWLGTARGTLRRSIYNEARQRNLGDWRLLAGFLPWMARSSACQRNSFWGQTWTFALPIMGATQAISCVLRNWNNISKRPALATNLRGAARKYRATRGR